jgi:hypothetical protein
VRAMALVFVGLVLMILAFTAGGWYTGRNKD